ncbi:MAG: hypothetical protein WAU25_00210 [Nitrososphaeraceae archaeon]
MAQRLETLEVGNHVIAVYATKEEKFNEAFAFLKEGLQRIEVIVLTTTDLSKDEIRARMSYEWRVNVSELESKGILSLKPLKKCISLMVYQIFSEQLHYGPL